MTTKPLPNQQSLPFADPTVEVERLRAALAHLASVVCPMKTAGNGIEYWECWEFDPSEFARRVLNGGPIYPPTVYISQ